jgi:hypothetical protein
MTNAEKSKFRQRVAWKRFREEQLERTNFTCEMCGQRYYGKRKKVLNVHHLDPERYDDLQEQKFKVLCQPCHEIVETMTMKICGKNRSKIKNLKQWLALIEDHLPFFARIMAKKATEEQEKLNG